nr:antitoxin VapB family protein [Candidatus Sigynarchaeota archaeon]
MMTQKTISLSEEAYAKLLKAKRKKESFSQLVMRLVGTETPADIDAFAGIWKEDDDWDTIEKEIYSRRLQPLERPAGFD